MQLNLSGIKDSAFTEKGYLMPAYDIEAMRTETLAHPTWVHFGAGNIMRAFPAVLCQRLLGMGKIQTGMCVVECYDEEIIDMAFTPYDNLTLAASLKSDGTVDKQVVGSIAEALGYAKNAARVREIMTSPSLQMVSMTITEKGYAVTDSAGAPLPFCKDDFSSMNAPVSIIGKLVSLLYARYQAGALPVAMVSMDNCAHNGTILKASVDQIALSWRKAGLVEQGFMDYLNDPSRVSFTWSMIDKITPRPAKQVLDMLAADGLAGMDVVVTSKNTYVSAMVNAEECQYLAIEDSFPNGRPPLDQVGVLFGGREMVDRIEKMKVCTCLNPLHTCLAIFGCLMGYEKISDEMKDDTLKSFIKRIGYDEGMPVVVDPVVMSAKDFIDEVIEKRLPNPFVPDTPQRIACDTSNKLPVRFGETLKAYIARGRQDLSFLTFIPLVFAGYARYLSGIADDGQRFELSPDPNLQALTPMLMGYQLGDTFDTTKLHALFSDASLFGVDLYAHGLGEKVEQMFTQMNEGTGAIRRTIEQYLSN